MIFKSFFYDTFTPINKINLLKTITNYKIKIGDKHMKTFNEIKEELKKECETKLEKISNITTGTPEFISGMKMEVEGIISNLDVKTKERIKNRTQHIIDMAKAGKTIDDIIKFNDLGINNEDVSVIQVINRWKTNYNNPYFENELKNIIETKYQLSKEETNKMRM